VRRLTRPPACDEMYECRDDKKICRRKTNRVEEFASCPISSLGLKGAMVTSIVNYKNVNEAALRQWLIAEFGYDSKGSFNFSYKVSSLKNCA
jgi:hypothetical protein